MAAFLIGRKIGMTRRYDADGRNVPVTVIQAGPCRVTQVKTAAVDGYDAVQIGFEDIKARNSTMPLIGHEAKAGTGPKRAHRELRLNAAEAGSHELGQALDVDVFEHVLFVDVTGTSKGKGNAGVMKRWSFKGQPATHGTERKHRSPGSIGGRASNRGTGKPKKGAHMAGRQGGGQVTVRSMEVVAVDKDKNLLLVKGPVPGANQGLLVIREAKRLYKGKAAKAAAAAS
jgi:large subunit ribosomal protein L3